MNGSYPTPEPVDKQKDTEERKQKDTEERKVGLATSYLKACEGEPLDATLIRLLQEIDCPLVYLVGAVECARTFLRVNYIDRHTRRSGSGPGPTARSGSQP